MKKLIALALCLMMALSAAAFADATEKVEVGSLEVNGEFVLKASLAEGYSVSLLDSDSLLSNWSIMNESDETKPVMFLSIGFDEAYANVERLNDLSEEELAAIEDTYAEYDMEFSYTETAHGTKLLMAVEVGDYTDYVSFFTIYKGYCVEFTLIAGFESDGTISDEQVEQAIQFLSDLDFEPIEAAE